MNTVCRPGSGKAWATGGDEEDRHRVDRVGRLGQPYNCVPSPSQQMKTEFSVTVPV